MLLKQHGEQILRTCGGLKFLGSQIDSDDHALNPSSAQVNFIVPTASALRKLKPTKLDVSKPRKPGVFHDVLDNMNTDPTVCYNLQFDGKLLKQGLTQHGGDIDCLGKEDPPTLQEQQYMHQVHMEQLNHISHILDQAYMQYTLTGSIPSPMVPPLREALLKFHALMSGTMKDLRHLRQQKLRAIEKFKRQGGEEWNKSRFHFVIDSCYTTIHIVDAILHNSVVVLKKLCCLASRINEANHLFANDTSVQLNLQSNYCSLKSPQTMLEEGIALTPETTLQRSPEWFAIRSSLKVTGSRLAEAVGVFGVNGQKQVFDQVRLFIILSFND